MLTLSGPPSRFRKTASPSQIDFEIAALAWLREVPHGVKVAEVLDHGQGWLTEIRLHSFPPSFSQAEEFGRRLAHTHAAGAPWLGAPPTGYRGKGWIGQAPLPLVSEASASSSWGEFYSQSRLRPYLEVFDADDRALMERLCDRLETGVLDHPQPALVQQPAARTHGDLWGGNVMWTDGGAVLIDPAASGGHAEDDLGALSLFGVPHFDRIVAGYQEVSPLAPGWEDRLGLHQLHLLTVHAYLFGGAYLTQTVDVASRYLPNRQ
ncbi:fructosamine kinase family protein [Actinomyces sp. F1_1611]